MTRLGTRPVQVVASIISVIGLLLLSRAGATGSYATGVLPGLVLFGIGIVGLAVPAQVAAIAEVGHEHAGAASGVVIGRISGRWRDRPRGNHDTVLVARHPPALDRLQRAGCPRRRVPMRGLLIAAAFAASPFSSRSDRSGSSRRPSSWPKPSPHRQLPGHQRVPR